MKKVITVASIAGSDSGSGAGIQADLRAMLACGVHCCTVITAVTAQNTKGVQSVHALPVEVVEAQLNAVLSDFDCQYAKIGMIANLEIADTVYKCLVAHKTKWVLDPVLKSTSRATLNSLGINYFNHPLFKYATLITPNLDEAALMLGRDDKVVDYAAMQTLAYQLQEKMQVEGSESTLLLKGGHLSVDGSSTVDMLLHQGEIAEYSHSFIQSDNTHGTGCTLASLITAYLAKGESLPCAVEKSIAKQVEGIEAAKEYQYARELPSKGPLAFGPVACRTPVDTED